MDWTLANTLVGIAVGLTTAIPIVIGWVVLPIRRHWDRITERITEIEEDHERDITYFNRRDTDQQATIAELKADLKDTRDRLERCEARWNNPPGFQV